jgi:hypothetical protein
MYVLIRRGIMKNYRSFPGLFLILFLMLGITSYSLALEAPVFSPLRYSIDDVQGTAVYTDTVTMGNVVSGEFHLVIQNGSGGKNKVDYAEVYVAGKRLVKMKSTKDLIDKKFKLIKDSELRVSLTGPKNSFVVVSIIAKKLTQVPLVIRMAQADAQAAMTASLLKIKKKPTFASHGFVLSGSVISQTPRAGVYVKEKTKASISVSTGPALAYNLLPGTPDSPASSSVVDYSSHDTITDTEITEILPGNRIARTKLEIGFTPNATVGQINDLLTSIGAQITAMLKGVNQVIVRIPDPGDLTSLDTLVAQIQSKPIVRYVLKGNMASTEALPPDVDVVNDPGLLSAIDHHLDVRAHAAWNVISLMGEAPNPPNLVVADNFGDGVPNKHFAVRASSSDFASGKLDSHGYHVLGILAATFHAGDTTDPERDWVTGLYPSFWFPYLWAVDLQKGYEGASIDTEIIQRLAILGKNVVVNTSLGLPCNGTFADRSCIEPAALSWIEKVRGSSLFATGLTGPGSLENTFIHLTAAGNLRDAAPEDLDARYTSEWTAARLLAPLIITETATPVVNLTNTLVIENRQKSPEPLEGLGCSAPDSKFPGDLSGIGENVWSLTGSSSGAGFKSGTSMATPQVASLAAYLWDLRPTLTPQEIKDILLRTADASPCGGINPMPLIDAYAAVLALDRGYANARVRGTLLDVVDASGSPDDYDWRFTEKDVEYYLGRFDTDKGAGAKDYSRYDLNGDGKTGGDSKAKFNLDMDYPPTYSTVHQIVEGNDVSFDENSLTDLEILCYYAYSRLYTGDTDKRKDLLKEKCGKEVPWELIFLQSNAEVSVGQCDECIKYQSIGDTGPTSPPLPLPANISTTCPPYSGTTETVQAGGGSLTIGFLGSGTRGVSECNPIGGEISTMVQSSGAGRMSTPGTYTVSISASPIFNPPDVLPASGYLLINFFIGNGQDWFRYISCTWGYRGVNDNQCCVEDPLGTTTCVPVGPYSVDIEVPQGINTWSCNMDMSGGDYIWPVDNPGDISVSDAVISVVPKP